MDNPGRLERRDSQQTFISLLQLEPSPIESPIESPSDVEKPLPELPDEASDKDERARVKRSSISGGFGLTGSNAMYYLARIQRYSSYAMGIFTSLHLASVSLIPLATRSVAGSEAYLLAAREIYQTPVSEPLLVAVPAIAHVGSGIALRLLRWRHNLRRYGGATPGMYALHRLSLDRSDSRRKSISLWPSVSAIALSGYAFAVFLSAHVCVNRLLPLAVQGDSADIGLAYVAHGFARRPVVSLAAYVGLIGTGSGHMVWGMAKWLGLAPSTRGWRGKESVMVERQTRRQRRRRWMLVHGIAMGVATLWAAGGLGVVARGGRAMGWIAKVYDELFARTWL
ncbi:hypothetical protein CDD81_2060 [Ophiocordyceps australis]|uniref:Mitochondrial adapter protein MCP1 transmembrane domain-containing protein n=1 Tax=Ophiocordyceps australis TaxID=1399860 RepID=A0A2C5XZM1_9HYPO|nr:hypothetical protein CDD81_2060 [Ophiocordyceps australis]